jgi:DsbC/DsbD-like thiol-disulfide interchange protein
MLKCKIQSKSWYRVAVLSALICIPFLMGFSLGWADGEVINVKTSVSQDGVHPGGMIDVAFLLDIIPGWHINGPELADPFLIACTLMIDEDDNIEVLELYYPVPETRAYSFSEVELQVYEGNVVLGARIKVDDAIPEGKNFLKASFLYQACDKISCMAPETLEFEIPFQVVPASQKIKQINQEIFAKLKFEKKHEKHAHSNKIISKSDNIRQ